MATATVKNKTLTVRVDELHKAYVAEAEQLDALEDQRRQIRETMQVALRRPTGSMTCNEVANAAGMTRDAAKNRLNRSVERGELESGWFKNVDTSGRLRQERWYRIPAGSDTSWELIIGNRSEVYARQQAELHECRRAALDRVDGAVQEARDAHNAAYKAYLEPEPAYGEGDTSLAGYCERHARAEAAYFAANPGTKEAHDVMAAAGQVVYNLRNGHHPNNDGGVNRPGLVELAGRFSWKNTLGEPQTVGMFMLDEARENPVAYDTPEVREEPQPEC